MRNLLPHATAPFLYTRKFNKIEENQKFPKIKSTLESKKGVAISKKVG